LGIAHADNIYYFTIHAKLTLVLTNDLVFHLFYDFIFARSSTDKQSSHRIAIPPVIALGCNALNHALWYVPFSTPSSFLMIQLYTNDKHMSKPS
jgi:hypothetical protein